MSILYEKIKNAAQKNAQKTAIVFYGKRYNYAKIFSLVERTAAGLKALGIKKGSVVTLCMPNTPSAMIAFYAVNRLGAVINLVHPLVSAEGLIESVKKTGSGLVVAYDLFLRDKGAELRDKLTELKENAEIKSDIMVYSSGSEYFMGTAAKFYFKLFQKNRKQGKKTSAVTDASQNPLKKASASSQSKKAGKASKNYPIFEYLFKSPEIDEPPAFLDKNEPAVYLPSGGTAGIPKIIVHRAGVFNELCDEAQFFLSEPLETYTAMYSVLPIFHGFGLCMSMHMCVVVGVKNVMSMKFNPKSVARAIKKERINVIMGVPAMFARLMDCQQFLKTDLSSMRDCFVGGDAVPKGLVENFNAALKKRNSNGRLYPGYGLTETVAVCTVNCFKHNKADSVGYPMPGAEIAVINDGARAVPLELGEICVKTPLLMLKYLDSGACDSSVTDNPVKDFEGGKWLFTGDLGFLDNDGFLFFKQRIKNMIKVKGVPVYPCEIEEAAESIPWIARAAAVGVPDKNSGEIVKLYVEAPAKELKKFFDKPDEEILKQIILEKCEKKLIRYAIPKIIEIREALPLNMIGKVDLKKLN